MKGIVATVFILVLLAVVVYFVLGRKGQSVLPSYEITPQVTNTVEPASEVNTLLQGGSSFADPNGLYTFLYPNDYRLDTSDEKHPRIVKTGATQKGETEIYDGVLMVFETIELGNQSLEEWVDSTIRSTPADGTSTIAKPKESITVNGYPGFTYTVRSLGESTYIVLQKDTGSKNALSIAYFAADPQNVGYQKEVDAILSTIELLK